MSDNPWANMNLGGGAGMGGGFEGGDEELLKVFSNFDFEAVEGMEGDEGDEGGYEGDEGDWMDEGDEGYLQIPESLHEVLNLVSEQKFEEAANAIADLPEDAKATLQTPSGMFVCQLITGEANVEVIKALIAAGVDINAPSSEDGDTLTFQAFSVNTPEVCQFLIEAKANLATEANSALHFAASNANHDTLSLCLNQGLDVNQRDSDHQTPLMVAAALNSPELLQKLIDAGAEVSPNPGPKNFLDGQVGIHFAVQNTKHDTVSVLLKAKADPHAKFADGEPVVLAAAQMATPAAVAALLEAGADWKQKSAEQDNILHFAARNLHNNTIETVLNLSADLLNEQDKDGNTPLISACQIGNLEAVKHLLAAKADTEIRNKKHMTALFEACRSGNPEILQALADAGADHDILGNYQKSLALAKKMWDAREVSFSQAQKIFEAAKNKPQN